MRRYLTYGILGLMEFFKKTQDEVTIISMGSEVQGTISAPQLHIDGVVKGKDIVGGINITIGSSGVTQGTIKCAGGIHVYGMVSGNIIGGSVSLHKGCVVKGSISYSNELIIEEHTNYSGTIIKL